MNVWLKTAEEETWLKESCLSMVSRRTVWLTDLKCTLLHVYVLGRKYILCRQPVSCLANISCTFIDFYQILYPLIHSLRDPLLLSLIENLAE